MEFLKSRAFPSFYKEYAPKLLEFFGSWVDWLNEKENTAYIIDHLSTENDIDESIEAYKTHLRNELIVDFPEEVSSDLKLLLKNIFYLYNSKSSIESYEFLFRCLFNASAEISYPKHNVLRLSDGRWYIPKYLKVKGTLEEDIITNFNSYYSLMIKGESSNAFGYIKKIEVYSFDNGDTFSNSLLLESVSGEFYSGEHLLLIDPSNGIIQNDLDLYVDLYAIGEGKWNGTYGFLDSDMYIQDSYFYQDFSYIIKSTVPASKWRTLVKKILHPAGLNLFANLETGGGGEDEEEIPVIKELNPLEFLRFWHIFFKLYIFETSLSIGLSSWSYKASETVSVGTQSHSETPDYWLFEGNYFSRDGINDIKLKDFNNQFNRSSVLMFKKDGTLINPDIIRWNDFTLTDDIETSFIYGVTLHPDNHMICGDFTGSEWKLYDSELIDPSHKLIKLGNSNSESLLYTNKDTFKKLGKYDIEDNILVSFTSDEQLQNITSNDYVSEYNNNGLSKELTFKDPSKEYQKHSFESYIIKNYLVFVSSTNDTSNRKIRNLTINQKYENFTNIDPIIKNSSLNDDVMIPIEKRTVWKNLTLNDFITINRTANEIFDNNSLVKIPESKVIFDETELKYVFLDSYYENEKIVIYNYSDSDIDEYYYIEDNSISQITLKKATEKEYVIAFIDGKFDSRFDVIKDKIYIRAKNFINAEFYILSRIEASRKIYQEYSNDKHFIYDNARILPFMYYNAHISSLDIIDYNTYLEIEELYNKVITINSLIYNKLNFIKYNLNLDSQYIIPSYNTLDNSLYFGNDISFKELENYKVSDIQVHTNRECTLLFDENGYLINPKNIKWGITEFKTNPNTSKLTSVILNPKHVSINKKISKYNLNNLGESNSNTLLYENFITYKEFGEYINKDDILSDLKIKTLENLSSINKVSNYDSTLKDNQIKVVLSSDELIYENELLFIDGKKMYPTYYIKSDNSYIIDNTYFDEIKYEYNLDIYEYNKNDIEDIIQVESCNTRFITLPSICILKENLLVFKSCLQTSDYYISGNTLCFNKDVNNEPVEIYIFKHYDYLFVTELSYNKNYSSFIPKNLKRLSLYNFI